MLYLPYAALLASVVSTMSTPQVQNKHLKLDFSVLRGDSRSSATQDGYAKVVGGDNYTTLYIANKKNYYSSTLKIGSNGNQNSVLVDTGSSDLWIMASDVSCFIQFRSSKRSIEDFPVFAHHHLREFESDGSTPTEKIAKRAYNATSFASSTPAATPWQWSANPSVCTSLGSFNTADSGSFKVNTTAPDFYVEYGDGSYASGIWGTDYVAVGGLNVSDVSIAIANKTSSEVGVLGIGLTWLEVTSIFNDTQPAYTYENFPVRLKSTGVINKVAYSLYLNDTNASSGTVLFGAVDHAKYSGQLQTVPIINTRPQIRKNPIAFYVGLDSVTLGDSKQNISIANDTLYALLDSGTTLTYLPYTYVDAIAASLNGKVTNSEFYEVSCKYNTSSAFVTYNLSGVQINAPLSDLILSNEKGTKCYLGLVSSTSGRPVAILGDSFLRHAYVVYNLEDYEISLAPVKYSNSENIEAISSTVPSAVKAPGYSSTSFPSFISTHPLISTTPLSTAGLKSSAESKAYYFAKSLLIGIVGVSLIFVL
ncbi:hypothetical protein JCM33374_g4822 [Metschnikowia sp. JCM 33374]|nr:hypothetical protein JCM33374_g4822 [Metschnikowia sp. JCM 33374]